MPRTLYKEDGSSVEVPNEEELKTLNESAERAKGIESLQSEIEELKQGVSPNWRAIREKEKRMKEALKKSGVETDEDGNVIEKKTEIKTEDIDARAKVVVNEQLFGGKKEELLASYPEKEKAAIQDYIDQMMIGKDKTITNLMKAYEDSVKIVYPGIRDPLKTAISRGGGAGPTLGHNDNKITEDTIAMGKDLGLTEEDIKQGGKVEFK